MLSTLYLLTMLGAIAAGEWQARLILANKPIHHGRWLVAYIAIGYGSAYVAVGPWWALAACVGMAGLFSLWFRMVLNARRGLLPSYMGPDPALGTDVRSRYDLFCWHLGTRLHWQPISVARCIEATAIICTSIFFAILHP